MTYQVHIIGGGLAGSEAAWQLAQSGVKVRLSEMRGVEGTPAHHSDQLAELVCSNSFRSDDAEHNAVGLLHAEMRALGSLIMRVADLHKVPAGSALAVDRDGFAAAVTAAIVAHPNIALVRERIDALPAAGPAIVATGPLTAPALAEAIRAAAGRDQLAFFDAIAPIVYRDSIDMDIAWMASRWDKGSAHGDGNDYINCPLDKEQYLAFHQGLLDGEKTEYKEWEERQAAANGESENAKLLRELNDLLQPEPGKFHTSVFDFYNRNAVALNAIIDDSHRQRLVELVTNSVFKNVDPGTHKLTITSQKNGAKSYTQSTAITIFRDAIVSARNLKIDVAHFRQRIINFIPFAFGDELKTIFDLLPDIKPAELDGVLKIYTERHSDLWRHQPSNLVEAVDKYHLVTATPVLREFVNDNDLDSYTRCRSLEVLDSLSPDPKFLRYVFETYRSDGEEALSSAANALLITKHGDKEAIRWRMRELTKRAGPYILERGVHTVGDVESELHNKSFAKPLMDLALRGYEEEYLGLLDAALALWTRGEEFHAYAAYIWDIAYAYFDNLKQMGSYDPLRMLERKISAVQSYEGANWLATRMAALRRSYLAYLGKPRRIADAIKQYNEARNYYDKKIRTSNDLFLQLKDAVETDLRRWIESEGAYDLILGPKVQRTKRQEYEKLIQRTIRIQIENCVLKRGFMIDIVREPQLYDETRTDFLVRYGFSGPVVIEVKLTSNTDIRGSKTMKSPSYRSMKKYMEGYEASHGIFLIVDNKPTKRLRQVVKTFESLRNVWAPTFSVTGPTSMQTVVKRKPKTKAKTKAKIMRREKA